MRKAGAEKIYLRITNFIMPNLCAIAGQSARDGGYQIDWQVPIDDRHHWKYTMGFSRSAPIVDKKIRGRRSAISADYRLIRNTANRYLQDREEMKTRSFSGMGKEFMVHDACVTETMGPIQERTCERLGYTDKAIVMARLLLLRAIRDVQQGRDPVHVIRDPSANQFSHLAVKAEVLPSSTDWKNSVHQSERV